MTREGFIKLVAKEQESLRRFLCLLCDGDSALADDIAQESLLKAYLSFERFEGRSRFSTWLFRIAYNCFYDNRRKSLKTERQDLPEDYDCPDSDQTADKKFRHQQLYMAIAALSCNEKEVVLLFYMEGKSVKEIEQITGIPSGTVRSHLSRARAHLREYLSSLI
ncbi:MAG: RNA polymerase sigma factor [Candidatus Cryptobacteroides sp.]